MGGISVEVLLALACAIAFLRAGRFESTNQAHDYGFLWALMSVLLSALLLLALKASWLGILAAQVALFFGIGVVRAFRDPA